MFSYQKSIFDPTMLVDEAQFYALVRGTKWAEMIDKFRQTGDQTLKRKLPAFIFQATFDETTSKSGKVGAWRKQSATRLTGLVVMDIDHVKNPLEVIEQWKKTYNFEELGIVLIYITPSGHGIKVVFMARPNWGNLIDNQHAMAQLLDVVVDESCKDASRMSFICKEEDIVFLDKQLFTYENKEFAERYEQQYREGHSSGSISSLPTGGVTFHAGGVPFHAGGVPSPNLSQRERDVLGETSQRERDVQGDPSPFGGGRERANTAQPNTAQPDSKPSTLNSKLSFKGIPYADIIAEWWKQQGGEPAEGERNTSLHRLAVHLRTICDNRAELLLQIMPRFGLSEQEMVSIINSATKDQPRGKTREIQAVLAALQQVNEECRIKNEESRPDGHSSLFTLNSSLENWGKEIEKLFPQFPILSDICRGLKPSQYPAALFVAGSFLMTLMTRCTYRFYHRPEELRRLNSSTIIVGDPASGKSFATRLWKLLMAPIFAADKAGKEAINAYRELMKTKGANKEKPKKPKVVVRVHPARTSNAQFIQDMVNAVETVDGEEMQLDMVTFDTELDNTLSIQKGGSWIDKISLELKAFHNEEDGQAYSNVDSVMQDFYVTWNYVYTGTPLALKKKVNEQNFGSGLATRLTCIPLPSTNFEMMSRERTVDYDSDARLKDWAFKLDRMKGELSLQKIVDELYEWTARRMADAKDNDSRADEMLLKRCAYHGLNFAAPFIVMRHWDAMQQEGDYWCGTFETDDIDWQLAELIVNMQFACQKHYFGAMAEAYFDNKLRDASVNVQRRQKTFDGFSMLPEKFNYEDVLRCFGLNSEAAARMRIARLAEDHLIEKCGTQDRKSIYRKTGRAMM